MLYYKCPLCRTLLANKQIPYEKGMEKICNSDMSDEEKDKAKRKLLDDLELTMQCCRSLMMTYVKLIDIVI